MLEELKETVCRANIELNRRGVVLYTWGNVSAIDRKCGLVVIKPSGVPYEGMTADDMVVCDLESGLTVEGKWRCSSDTPTHLELYRNFSGIGGIVHTHSVSAVSFAQAGMNVPALGTTHADYFYGDIPCTRALTKEEVDGQYELNTGKVIAETIRELGYDPMTIPGIIVRNHGPFTWGNDADEAVYNAVVLETVCKMAINTLSLNPCASMDSFILDRHYFRKHGRNAYYGQKR